MCKIAAYSILLGELQVTMRTGFKDFLVPLVPYRV